MRASQSLEGLRPSWSARRSLEAALLAAALAACTRSARPPAPTPTPTPPPAHPQLAHAIIPAPSSVQITPTDSFAIDTAVTVVIEGSATADVERVARVLAEILAPAAAPGVRILRAGETPAAKSIFLALDPRNARLGGEGYELTVTRDRVTLTANQAAGLYYGVQTIRQLLPWSVEHRAAIGRRLKMPAAHVVDTPRFAWRGAMLDVARHFLPAEDVKRFIDYLALYKLNRLHLHLADDQGWRIDIKSWPNLAAYGGSTQVGGGAGGYYTQEQFADIVAYAQAHYVTIVPEIDMPAHINAATASYPVLSCLPDKPALYTGTHVGFSALCVDGGRDSVYKFVNDVVREISALSPGPYFHIGGDEVQKLTHAQYTAFIERAEGIVNANGKEMIGWGEIARANLRPTTIAQQWANDSVQLHVARGGKVILSPGSRMYIDMKYDSTTVLGLRWAGLVDVRTVYDWEPATFKPGVPGSAILGVEAPLWSETVVKRTDYEYMAFPRLAAVAEVGWSPAAARGWDAFALRLGAHGPRMQALGINFYRSPQVPWMR